MAGVPGYMTSKTHTRLGSLMYSGPMLGQSTPSGAVSFLQNRFNETTRLTYQDDMGIIAEVIGKASPIQPTSHRGSKQHPS
jgi:hypothetical protein